MAHAVNPKSDCPHLASNFTADALPPAFDVTSPCSDCASTSENWICLHSNCLQVSCSRFVHGHAVGHFDATRHAVALSFSDLSVWCYACDSYIQHSSLQPVLRLARDAKFGPGADQPLSESDAEKPSDESDDEAGANSDSEGVEQMIRQLSLNLSAEAPTAPPVLPSLDFDGLVEHIKSGKAKKIIVMSGAGVSVAAGIPDFRTPGTGLYDNLQKYNLPEPTAVFDISFFKDRPEPFFMLAKELYPGNFKPTAAHYFVRLLHDKGLLLRNFTQNIDTLERVAKVPPEMLVEAHGSFGTATCVQCKAPGDIDFVKECVFSDKLPRCHDCQALIKPDIVFFGESLPARFYKLVQEDFPQCDLLIVLGTSLKVHPFASLIDFVSEETPRVLINREMVGLTNPLSVMLGQKDGFQFGFKTNRRDVALLGDLQDTVWKLVEALGWKDELEKLISDAE